MLRIGILGLGLTMFVTPAYAQLDKLL